MQNGDRTPDPTFCRNGPEMDVATPCINRHSECWQSRRLLWLVNEDFIAARTRVTGECNSFSRTDGASEHKAVAHALRAGLDIRKAGVKVLFAGSSEAALREMFSRAAAPVL